jgi:hypothetical protein
VVNVLKKANAIDPKGARLIIPDRVHPEEAGHLIMAGSLLKAWGATPMVTNVEIDAAATRFQTAANTAATNLKSTGTRITWIQKDMALPMPINMNDPATKLAVNSSDILQTLNQQVLKVRGLKESNYQLKINGAVVGSFSAEQFSKGINLAVLPTPMVQQAAAVHALTLKRGEVHNTRWRNLQMPFAKDSLPRVSAIIDNLDALVADIAANQHATAQPAACFYELVPE